MVFVHPCVFNLVYSVGLLCLSVLFFGFLGLVYVISNFGFVVVLLSKGVYWLRVVVCWVFFVGIGVKKTICLVVLISTLLFFM